MKTRKILLFIIFLSSAKVQAQVQIYDPKKVAERSVENRANSRVNQGVDRGLDKVEEGIGNLLFGKKKKKEDQPSNNQQKPDNSQNASQEENNGNNAAKANLKTPTLQTYNKFDFMPGEKIVVQEDFSQDAIGDFPDKWNTNSTGELVNIEGKPGKWLSLSKDGTFLPEFITGLPENFTLEFDLITNAEFSFYSSPFNCIIASLASPKDFAKWGRFIVDDVTGIELGFHPMNAGSSQGTASFIVYNNSSKEDMKNETNTSQFFANFNNYARVSIWRQKQRLRVYMNEEKVWDLPRALTSGTNYNAVLFMLGSFQKPEDRYLISNVRLAVGAPDTRNKLITEGKFVTTGILFDVNSAVIKPESYGTLKSIAQVLQENADIKVKIIGHTDSDGDDNANLKLSKLRAESVKAALSNEFGINASRMESDGKGESQPTSPNTSSEGKANNRRVEFIKL
ncbi:OmpA family protein [Pseudarcicella hirudinis]|uniref:OmpA family protein n=1 Tax=Pseudarcicella hirudinis TaxID=1079859 RepID=A0A1I5YZI0_9BACT|nr:OmpA family protein [Pseudarcicella hirudinis]SFQ49678.1 OmpA family protein [Pseudarcicella hirudinis]